MKSLIERWIEAGYTREQLQEAARGWRDYAEAMRERGLPYVGMDDTLYEEPEGLSPQERVRFIEHGIAAMRSR